MKKLSIILLIVFVFTAAGVCKNRRVVVFQVDPNQTSEVLIGFNQDPANQYLENAFWFNSEIAKPYPAGPGGQTYSYDSETVFKIVYDGQDIKYYIDGIIIWSSYSIRSCNKLKLQCVGNTSVSFKKYK